MKAARWHGVGDVRVEEVDEPTIQNDDDVIVAIDLATICASDLAEWRDGPHVIPTKRPHPLTEQVAPITLGHEYVGRVVATGAAVYELEVGDRVCGDACLRCHTCYWCLRGEYNICAKGASVGLHLDGAFANLLRVPSYALVPVPDEVPDEFAAIVEPVAVGSHALRQVGFQGGDIVVVQGFGMIGAGATVLARAMGAGQVIVVEKSDERSILANELCADIVLNPDDDIVRSVRNITGSRGADVVLDCTGSASGLATAVEMSRRGGKIGLCGIPHGESPLRTDRVVYFERQIVGCLGYRYDHITVLDLMKRNHIATLATVFGERIELDAIVEHGLNRIATDPGAPLRIPIAPNC